jgi:hypothetical protein
MEVKVSIESRHIVYLIVALLIISGINYAIAYGGNQPSVVGHNAEEIGEGTIAGILTISGGRVGIGEPSPQEVLDVAGDVRIQGNIRIQSGSPGSGKVLTSDSDGDASWQQPADDESCRICKDCGGDWWVERGNWYTSGVWGALGTDCSGSWSDSGSPRLYFCCTS